MKKINQTHLSVLGGTLKKLDTETILKELNSKGYKTPENNLWHKISVTKHGKFLAMIDVNESYFTVNGKPYAWTNTDAFIENIELTFN